MAEQGRYTYKLDVENSRALKKLADFAKASAKSTQRIERDIANQQKSNNKLGGQLRQLKLKYKDTQNSATEFARSGKVPKTVIDSQRKLKGQISAVRTEIEKGKRAASGYRQELSRIKNVQVPKRSFTAPGLPSAPVARRGFGGNVGRRAGVGRALAGRGGGAGMAGAALTGGVAGLAAAAAGQAIQLIEDLAKATAQYANDAAVAAAETSKLRLSLAGVLGSEAPAAFESIKKAASDFNIPIRNATRQYTRFAASAKASGVGAEDIEKSFRGLIAANKALGGSQEQANGIMLAATQVFGKGKVSAEELRGQIGERLPGAVALFAKSMGLTTAELDKRLEEGTVSVADFVNFAANELGNFEKDALKISQGPEEAGARLKKSLDDLQIAVGTLLAPIGAAFQQTFAAIVNAIIPAINALNTFLGLTPEAAFDRAQSALESRQADLTNAIKGKGKLVNVGQQGSARRQTENEARAELDQAIKTLDAARRRLGTGTGTIEKSELLTSADLMKNRSGSGGGGGTGPDLNKIAAQNARRIADENARQVLAIDRQRFEILKRLRTEDQRLAEANLTGTERAQLAITNAYVAQNEAISDQVRELDRAVDKAQANLDNAKKELAGASKPADILRAEGRVGVAEQRLAGASARRGQFGESVGQLRANALGTATAASTEGFRNTAADAAKEAQALRERNRLMLEGFSPTQIEGQMRINELERERLEQIQQLNPEMAGYNTQLQAINETSQSAKDAVNELTAAQEANSGALAQYVASASEYVNNIQARMVDIATTIEQGIATAITGLLDGTMTATQAFQNFFKEVGKAFLQMAAQMIAKLIVMSLLKSALGMNGGGGFLGGLFGGGGFNMGTTAMGAGGGSVGGISTLGPNFGMPAITNANGNVLRGGFQAFAKGGIVKSPTLGLVGEGSMNEAVVPLPDGRSIPISMGKKGMGGNVNTNITVNVDQGGNTDSQTSGDSANKLGKAIDSAVKRVIMDERRSGGLLYNGKR